MNADLLLHMKDLAVFRDALDLVISHGTQQGGLPCAITANQAVSTPKGHGNSRILHKGRHVTMSEPSIRSLLPENAS